MPTEKEFMELFDDEVSQEQNETYAEDALRAAKRAGFTFDPETVTPEQTEQRYRDWTVADRNRLEDLERLASGLSENQEALSRSMMERRKVADATADALRATADAVDALTQRLIAEEDRVGQLENQIESYKGQIEALFGRIATGESRMDALGQHNAKIRQMLLGAAKFFSGGIAK